MNLKKLFLFLFFSFQSNALTENPGESWTSHNYLSLSNYISYSKELETELKKLWKYYSPPNSIIEEIVAMFTPPIQENADGDWPIPIPMPIFQCLNTYKLATAQLLSEISDQTITPDETYILFSTLIAFVIATNDFIQENVGDNSHSIPVPNPMFQCLNTYNNSIAQVFLQKHPIPIPSQDGPYFYLVDIQKKTQRRGHELIKMLMIENQENLEDFSELTNQLDTSLNKKLMILDYDSFEVQ